jgi:hypothetical protein
MLCIALCYVLALQAFAASLSTVRAIGYDGGSGSGFVICHNIQGERPADGDGTLPNVPCSLCAAAASAVVLAAPLPVGERLVLFAAPVEHFEQIIPAALSPVRAGTARSPPHIVLNG